MLVTRAEVKLTPDVATGLQAPRCLARRCLLGPLRRAWPEAVLCTFLRTNDYS